jgi:hypothetical protein
VFVLSPSSLFHIIVKKTSCATFPDPKEAGIKQIAMTSDCYAQRPMEYSTGKE